jgi:hypothetical protein
VTVTGKLKLVDAVLAKFLQSAIDIMGAAGAGGALNPAYAGLLTQWKGFSGGITAADVTEPAYNGYARHALIWGAVGTDSTGRPSVSSGSVAFAPTDNLSSVGVQGIAIYDAATGGNLLGVALLPQKFTFHQVADVLNVVITVSLTSASGVDYGSATAIR